MKTLRFTVTASLETDRYLVRPRKITKGHETHHNLRLFENTISNIIAHMALHETHLNVIRCVAQFAGAQSSHHLC